MVLRQGSGLREATGPPEATQHVRRGLGLAPGAPCEALGALVGWVHVGSLRRGPGMLSGPIQLGARGLALLGTCTLITATPWGAGWAQVGAGGGAPGRMSCSLPEALVPAGPVGARCRSSKDAALGMWGSRSCSVHSAGARAGGNHRCSRLWGARGAWLLCSRPPIWRICPGPTPLARRPGGPHPSERWARQVPEGTASEQEAQPDTRLLCTSRGCTVCAYRRRLVRVQAFLFPGEAQKDQCSHQ